MVLLHGAILLLNKNVNRTAQKNDPDIIQISNPS